MASKQLRWRDVVHLQPRYRRSVHLERDFFADEALTGYVATPLVRATADRIAEGLRGRGGRAWSFTGPYGSGKSAFALFVANLFHYSPERHAPARKLLERADPELFRRLFTREAVPLLCPVLATGERRSLEAVVLSALTDAAHKFWAGSRPPRLVAELAKAATLADRDRVSSRDVVRFVETFSDQLAKSTKRRGTGLLILIDEAGKALEFAAQHPDRADIHLLQELAELASRSGEQPIVISVLLHQAFEQYATRLGSSQRNEWAKVQGRFEDVPFQEAADQILRLVSQALGVRELPEAQRRQARDTIEDLVAAVNPPGLPDKVRLARVLAETLPLHPVTALLLGPLFRSQISQNERSLFAFLSSAEPGAFQEFLGFPVCNQGALETYRPDRLFNYLGATFGERLYRHGGRQWALIHDALARLPKDASELDARVVKTIGLLGMLGEGAGIPASEKVVQLALADSSVVKQKEVSAALERLKADSRIVYRRFRDCFQMWDGSDLDLDERIRAAAAQLDPGSNFVTLLSRAVPPRPIVARRHLFEAGTLRYFEVRYGDESILESEWDAQHTKADGVVWLVVPTSDGAGSELETRLMRAATWGLGHSETTKPIVVGVIKEAGRVREAAIELAALDWVRAHTAELAGDPVARKELAGRTVDAENVLRGEIGAFLTGDRESVWIHRGKDLEIGNGRQLGAALSALCDRVYDKAPKIHNELINRNQLSSAAAAARRELMVAMATKRDQARLGIEGAPPEFSMYRSILEQHRLHGQGRDGRFGLLDPPKEGSLYPAVEALHAAMGSDGSRVPVRRIYDLLVRPPFGMKDGVIPVILLWAMLKEEAEIALYEENAFVPVIDAPVIERLGRRPERFELQRFRIKGAREKLFEVMTGSDAAAEQGPLVLVRQFVKIVQELPAYTRNTRDLSSDATKVRDAILRAKEPGTLIFNDLPQACGFEPLSGSRAKALPDGLVNALHTALKELRSAYPRLLDSIRGQLQRALGLPAPPEEARSELAARARQLSTLAADPQLKTFLIRAADDSGPIEAWTASLATYLGGRPPESWSDPDLQRMSVQLTMIARKFTALEAAFLEHQQAGLPEGAVAVRVSVTEAGHSEAERVVVVRNEARSNVQAIVDRLREAVQAEQADSAPETVIAGLAQLLKQLIGEATDEAATAAGEKR